MLRVGLIIFNLLFLVYLIWDSFALIGIHQAEGVLTVFQYIIRCVVVSVPLFSLFSLICPLKKYLMYLALALNGLMVLASFFGYYVVLFEGGYKFQAVYIIAVFTLAFSFNGVAVWLMPRKSLQKP